MSAEMEEIKEEEDCSEGDALSPSLEGNHELVLGPKLQQPQNLANVKKDLKVKSKIEPDEPNCDTKAMPLSRDLEQQCVIGDQDAKIIDKTKQERSKKRGENGISDAHLNVINKQSTTPGSNAKLEEVSKEKQQLECSTCHKMFKCKFNHSNHICIKESDLSPESCEEDSNSDMRKKTYPCDNCGKEFSSKSSLKTHIRCVHSTEKPFACQICDKQFSLKTILVNHMRIHTGEKYSCVICSKQFTDLSTLSKHKRVHTGQKPYTCDVCKKNFTGKSNLACHIRTHTGEKPYKCDVCKKKFAVPGTLAQHKRLHTGEKPHSCVICERQFTHKYTLNH